MPLNALDLIASRRRRDKRISWFVLTLFLSLFSQNEQGFVQYSILDAGQQKEYGECVDVNDNEINDTFARDDYESDGVQGHGTSSVSSTRSMPDGSLAVSTLYHNALFDLTTTQDIT